MATPHLQAAAGMMITAVGELVLLAQAPPGNDLNSVTSGTPGLWFAIGGIITALGTTIVQPYFKERGTEGKLADALVRIRSLEADRDAAMADRRSETAEKQKALDLLAHVTERNIGLTKLLERLTAADLVRAGRHVPGVPISLMIDDGPIDATGPLVLLVEDDPQARVSGSTLLQMAHFRVEAVATLGEALEALERKPDFVMLDLMLPDGDGLELLRRVRDDGLSTKVIVTTGKDKSLLGPVADLAPLALLRKPCDFNQIFALMKGKPA